MTEDKTSAIEVAVIGAGRMGRHHVRTYANLPEAKLVGVVDADLDRANEATREHGGAAFASVEALLAAHPNVRAASVAVPTSHHLSVAGPLLERGLACLVEKPLAGSVEEARALARIAQETGTPLQVGHTERFNPAVRALARMGFTPRFMEVDRISPMTFRSLDVGVVMDMMIHDLDIVLTLAGSPLSRVDATGVAVMGEHEDVANVRLVFENGCVANVTASRLALKTERKLRLFSEDAYVSLDYQKRTGLAIRKAANTDVLARVREQLAKGADLSDIDYSEIVSLDPLDMGPDDEQDPLTAELRSFVEAVRDGSPTVVDAEAGLAAVEAAHRVVEAMKAHRWEGIEEARM